MWLPAMATLVTPTTLMTLMLMRFFSTRLSNGSAHKYQWSKVSDIVNQVQTVVLTIVATAALGQLFPNRILSCQLEQQWQAYFRSKNAHAVRSIQDEFRCCGLRSLHDRAWPFKDQNHGDNACELQLAYQRSCLAPWGEHQQSTAWMIFAAAVLGFVAKIALVQLSAYQASWLSTQSASRGPGFWRISHQAVQQEGDVDGADEGPRGALLPHSNINCRNDWQED
ncbi:unnamed protein product [Penicillium olsonii]|uniref:Tetraspanin Tsp3 n=1 Tax=Penicillium olsonii TaxID=99116 RepID=A0A9W4I3I2_PENOL|nr:unnamed protein product [Penicillium olsonii]